MNAGHIVLVFAEADRAAAQRLWLALKARGVSAGLMDDTTGTALATALVAVCSAAAAESVPFTEAVERFLAVRPREAMFAVGVGCERPDMPPVLLAARGADGFLAPSHPPVILGGLLTDQRSVNRLADAIASRFSPRPAAARGFMDFDRRAIVAAGIVLALALPITIWQFQVANAARVEAAAARTFASRLLTDITEHLPDAARQSTLVAIADELTANFLDEPLGALSDDEVGRRARLYHLIGEARDLHGDPAGARLAFETAFEHTAALLARAPRQPDRMFDHSQSAFWLGNSAYRAGDLAEAGVRFETYRTLAERMVERAPLDAAYQAELGHAATNLGVVALERGEAEAAAQHFAEAVETFRGAPLEAGAVGVEDIANSLGWQAEALVSTGDIAAAEQARLEEAGLLAEVLIARPGDALLQASYANAVLESGRIAVLLGRIDEADIRFEAALEAYETLTRDSGASVRTLRAYFVALSDRARLAMWSGDLIRAQLLLGEARRVAARSNLAGGGDGRHAERSVLQILAAELALRAGAVDTAIAEAAQAVLASEQALAEGWASARSSAAYSAFLQGEALAAGGRLADARTAWRAVLRHLDARSGDGASMELADADIAARARLRLGETTSALAMRSRLDEAGYARPDHTTFWLEADRALNASASQLDTNGG